MHSHLALAASWPPTSPAPRRASPSERGRRDRWTSRRVRGAPATRTWLGSWMWIEAGQLDSAEEAVEELRGQRAARLRQLGDGRRDAAGARGDRGDARRSAGRRRLSQHAEAVGGHADAVAEHSELRVFLTFYMTTAGGCWRRRATPTAPGTLRGVARPRGGHGHALLRRRDVAAHGASGVRPDAPIGQACARRSTSRARRRPGPSSCASRSTCTGGWVTTPARSSARDRRLRRRRRDTDLDERAPADDAAVTGRARVAILGGGMAGLAAAWRLSEPGWRDELRVDHGLPARAGGSAARARAAGGPTGGSRSTGCTCGSATTRTRSASCASATPSSIGRERPGGADPDVAGRDDPRRRRSGSRIAGRDGWHHWLGQFTPNDLLPGEPDGARRAVHARRHPAPRAAAGRRLPRVASRRPRRVREAGPQRLADAAAGRGALLSGCGRGAGRDPRGHRAAARDARPVARAASVAALDRAIASTPRRSAASRRTTPTCGAHGTWSRS